MIYKKNCPNKKCYAENKMKRMVFIENGCSATVIHRASIWKKMIHIDIIIPFVA